MFNKLLKRLSLMLLAIPALTLSSCNLFEGISSSSQGPNPPSETSSESDSKESSESESSESIESIESEESSESESSESIESIESEESSESESSESIESIESEESSESESSESIESINEVTITFHANWNYGETVLGEPAPKILTVASGTYITDDMLPVVDERTGYAFKAWCTTPAGIRTFDWSKAIEKDYDVYASWIDLSAVDKVGLVGTINGWDPTNDDYLLISTDGIHYIIEDVLLKAGDIWNVVRNNSWDGQIDGNHLNTTPDASYYEVIVGGMDDGNIKMLKGGYFDITVDLSAAKSLSFELSAEYIDPNPIVDYEVYLAGSFTTPEWFADESTKFTGTGGTYTLTDYVFPAGEFKLNVFPVLQDGTKGSIMWVGASVIAEMPEGWSGTDNIIAVAGTYTLTYTIAEGAAGDAGVLTIVETQKSYAGLIIENGVVIGYEGIDNEIIIPSEYEGVPVTSIGDYAFDNCTSLTSIIIPNSVTSIGEGAFYYCESLTSINIPNSVTTIGLYVFNVCTSLTSINVDSNNAYYTSIDGILYSNDVNTLICCPGGKVGEVIIPNSVTSIGKYAFFVCASLTSVTIPDSVTSIDDNAFWECTSLTSINVDSNNAYYTSIDGILYSNDVNTLICCPGGKVGEVIIPNSVTSIGAFAFENCTSLTSINIPNSVTSIGYNTFSGCFSLTSIIIPNSVTSIGDFAFAGCFSLTSINIPNSVTSISNYAFSYCHSLTSINIPNSVTSIGDSAFYYCTSLTSINIPNSVTSISNYAFSYCTSLTSITIPDSVTSIGRVAFRDCDNLTIYCEAESQPSGWYTDWNPDNRPVYWGVSKDNITFDEEKSFVYILVNDEITITDYIGQSISINIPSEINGYPVTSIGAYAFYGCTSLTSINIPNSVTSIDGAFYYCTSLISINVDSNNAYYTSIDGILYSNDATTLICCPAGKVGEVDIPNSVTSISNYAFSYCTSLTSINIPNSVTSIGDFAFVNCHSLTSINIPDSVTSIGDWAFVNCRSLTSINIPNSVTSIGDFAFAYCSSLTIYCEAESQPSGWSLYWNPDNRPVIWGA